MSIAHNELKFRVLDKKLDRFLSIDELNRLEINGIGDELWIEGTDFERYVFQRSSGLHDRNGILMYEADEVYCYSTQTQAVVTFVDGCFRFGNKWDLCMNNRSCEVLKGGSVNE